MARWLLRIVNTHQNQLTTHLLVYNRIKWEGKKKKEAAKKLSGPWRGLVHNKERDYTEEDKVFIKIFVMLMT